MLGADSLHLLSRSVSKHAHNRVVTVEDPAIDGRVQDSGQVRFVYKVAKLVGRFERQLAILARADVAEDEDYAANLSVACRSRAAFEPERRTAADGPHGIIYGTNRFARERSRHRKLVGRKDLLRRRIENHHAVERTVRSHIVLMQAAGGSGVGEDHALSAIKDEHRVGQGIQRGSDQVAAAAIGSGKGRDQVGNRRPFESVRYTTFRREPGATHVSFILLIALNPLVPGNLICWQFRVFPTGSPLSR